MINISNFILEQRMGTVTLISNVWDFIPRVEIRQGNSSVPELNPLQYSGSAVRNQEWRSQDGVSQFYRRSADPSNPSSGLANWSENARTISGNEYWSLD